MLLSFFCVSYAILGLLRSVAVNVNKDKANEAKNDVQYFELKDEDSSTGMFSHLDMVDPNASLRPMGFAPLDTAHKEGRIHLGAWIHVVHSSIYPHENSNEPKILLLKREEHLVTCPSTWSLVGEHTYRDEMAVETVKRAIREELGADAFLHLQRHGRITPLTEFPIYYERDYGASNGHRIDRQLTYLWLVEMNVDNDVDDDDDESRKGGNDTGVDLEILESILQLDDEVAEHKWISLQEYSDLIEEDFDRENKLFCHNTIVSLTDLGLKKIMEMREKAF